MSIRIRTIKDGKLRKLAAVKGKRVRFVFEAATWHSDVRLRFSPGYGVMVNTRGVLYPTTCGAGEPLSNGLLVTHTACALRVFIPLPDHDWPTVRILDERGVPVPLGKSVRAVKWRSRIVRWGRAILLRLLVAMLLHLAGCSVAGCGAAEEAHMCLRWLWNEEA